MSTGKELSAYGSLEERTSAEESLSFGDAVDALDRCQTVMILLAPLAGTTKMAESLEFAFFHRNQRLVAARAAWPPGERPNDRRLFVVTMRAHLL